MHLAIGNDADSIPIYVPHRDYGNKGQQIDRRKGFLFSAFAFVPVSVIDFVLTAAAAAAP